MSWKDNRRNRVTKQRIAANQRFAQLTATNNLLKEELRQLFAILSSLKQQHKEKAEYDCESYEMNTWLGL